MSNPAEQQADTLASRYRTLLRIDDSAAGAPTRAVVFDMDGLLLDTERLSRRSWLAAGTELGVPLSLSVLTTIIGRRRTEVELEFRAALGPDFPVDTLYARHAVHYHAQLDGISTEVLLKPGVLALLNWLDARGVPRAVATSTLAKGAASKLARAGLTERFPIVVSGDQVAHSKPAPDIFLEAARRLGVHPSRCVVFEDSDLGMEGAMAAGMRAIAVPDLKPMPAAIATRAEAVLTSLAEAVPVLERLWVSPDSP